MSPPVELSRRTVLGLALWAASGAAALADDETIAPGAFPPAVVPVETPSLLAEVSAGRLPPIADRLPKRLRIIDLPAAGREIGVQGGTWRMLMGDQRDLRMMTIYSYTRLLVFNEKFELVADILERLDNHDDKVFTLHLREGHRWSDGHPFTAEDFRYFWDDVANNKKLSPSGPNLALLAGGQPPSFEVLDPSTVRFSWAEPNPGFLPALAAAQPVYIFMPAHYLKQFHPKYADPDRLAALVKAAKVSSWVGLHERMSRQYRPENPALPTLDTWMNTTAPPAEQFRFVRNPYFHRVDTAGHQLPYLDEATLTLSTTSLIPAKTAAGEADLQARYLNFDDYTFLKAAESVHRYDARLWELGQGAFAAIFPNLNAKDPVWRALNRDVRFRRALSLGVNRHDINEVIFFGLARESGDTVLPQSPLYKPAYAEAYATHDLAQANALLDAAGLDKRDSDGVRLLSDGRRAEITIETSGENPLFVDILQLIGDDWAKLGIRMFAHPSQLDIFRQRIASGDTIMSIDRGLDNALPTAEIEPDALAPTLDSQHQWPQFGLFVQSAGHEGQTIDVAEARRLLELYHDWRRSSSLGEQRQIWTDMLAINADQCFAIGIVNGTRQPVVISRRMRNVPVQGLFSFEPGSFFGIYMPDTFFYADAPKS